MTKAVTIEAIDEILPQTQCGQCGYPGCQPYATAIVKENAAINLCVPGGNITMEKLSLLTNRHSIPVNITEPIKTIQHIAKIDESICIGCTKCIKACPVDAIVGAAKQMHTVIDELCTGCDLCIPACPVDCITMEKQLPEETTWIVGKSLTVQNKAKQAKQRFINKNNRQTEQAAKKQAKDKRKAQTDIKIDILNAVKRAKQRRASLEVN